MEDRPTLLWFRRDLRLSDNPAAQRAAEGGAPVIPVFVLDESPSVRAPGGASRWWLDKALAALAADLKRLDSRLILRRGPAEQAIPRLVAETGARAVYWNRLYEPPTVERDRALKTELHASGLKARTGSASLLIEPWEIATGSGTPFKVFTAFWRAARPSVDPGAALAAPAKLPPPGRWPASERLTDWGLHPHAPDWSGGFTDWRPGEAGAQAALTAFIDEALARYPTARDSAAGPGTSRLSPHLHWGEIGPRQVWRAVEAATFAGEVSEPAAEKFLAELGWREFNHHLMFHDAPASGEPPEPAWRDDPQALEAWRRGNTGYPIVDAAMRELWATGWAPNRLRMVVASFLVKHLLIDWREGERWFWDTLVDADQANNPANWRWIAGCDADAAPFFRIFNPDTQGQRFDPTGAYVRRWAPELGGLPAPYIHAPCTAPQELLSAAGVRLGLNYPAPIVEHRFARARALEAHAAARSRPA